MNILIVITKIFEGASGIKNAAELGKRVIYMYFK